MTNIAVICRHCFLEHNEQVVLEMHHSAIGRAVVPMVCPKCKRTFKKEYRRIMALIAAARRVGSKVVQIEE